MRSVFASSIFGVALWLATGEALAEPAEPAAEGRREPEHSAAGKPSADTTQPQEHAAFVEPANELSGFILGVVPASVAAPFGSYAEGVEATSFGPGMGFGLLVGFYATKHVGVVGGFSGSIGHRGVEGCKPKDDRCGGTRFQFPLLLQYALRNRKEGLYVQTGLGLASNYQVRVEGAGAFDVSSPFDAKFGLGYRLSQAWVRDRDRPSRWSLDFFGNLDVGQFQHTSGVLVDEGSKFSGEIARPAMHYLIELGMAVHWTP